MPDRDPTIPDDGTIRTIEVFKLALRYLCLGTGHPLRGAEMADALVAQAEVLRGGSSD